MGQARRRSRPAGVIAALFAAMVVAACGESPTSTAPPKPASTPAAVLVTTATADVGGTLEIVLTDANGRTLYYHTPDRVGQVNCTDATECADNWPPLKLPSKNARVLGGQRVAGTFGTVPSPGGGSQVTYNGWPLYRFVNDVNEGDARGQGLGNQQWFVATPTLASAT